MNFWYGLKHRDRRKTADSIVRAAALIRLLPGTCEWMLTSYDDKYTELDISCQTEQDLRMVAALIKRPFRSPDHELTSIKEGLLITAYKEPEVCRSSKSPSPAYRTTKSVLSDGASDGSPTECQSEIPLPLASEKRSTLRSRLTSILENL